MFNLRNIALVIAVILVSLLLNYSYKIFSYSNLGASFISQLSPQDKNPQVEIENTKISVELAITYDEKDKGLGGRSDLGKNEGMLFVFDYSNVPIFWMKGMLIPLDIIWISDDTVVDLHKNVEAPEAAIPYSNLLKYSPKEPVNYVLEVNAGFSDENGIQVGDKVEFSNI
jgi:uncharacterized membrane protein (UPF0127 family)